MNRLSYLWVALVLLCIAGRGAEADPPLAVAPYNSDQAKALQKAWADHLGVPVQITNSLGMKLNLIPPGEFTMGSPESEENRGADETQHQVMITKPFYLSVHEVTQAQYERVMGDNPSRSKDAAKPVEHVAWRDAVEFCRRLSAREVRRYCLPTEAEWEYACRAGTTTTYSFGDARSRLGEYAWYNGNRTNPNTLLANDTPHPVGELKPNAWGLFDMHGNVKEWCQDRYGDYEGLGVVSRDPTGPASGDDGRVLRGGSFGSPPVVVRAAHRYSLPPDFRHLLIGFRLATTIPLSP